MILYFFYKNCVFSITHFIFGFYCLFSGQTIIDDWFITCFNLVFTSIPLAVQAVTDVDLLEEDKRPLVEDMMPFLYKENRNEPIFSVLSFILTFTKGIIFGIINILIVILVFRNKTTNEKGDTEALWFESLIIFSNDIFGVSLVLLEGISNYNYLIPLVVGITTFLLYFIFLVFVHFLSMFNSQAAIGESLKFPAFYMILFLYTTVCYLLDKAVNDFRYLFKRTMRNVLLEYLHREKRELDSNGEEKKPNLIKKAYRIIEKIIQFNDVSFLRDNQPNLFKKSDSNLSNAVENKTSTHRLTEAKRKMAEKCSSKLTNNISSIYVSSETNLKVKKKKRFLSLKHSAKSKK